MIQLTTAGLHDLAIEVRDKGISGAYSAAGLQDCMQQQQPQHEVKDYKDLAVCNSDVLTEKGNLKPKKYNALNIG